MASEDIKLKMPAGARALKTEVTRDPLNMLSLALLYILAVVCSARRTHALPLYSDTALPQQEGKINSVLLIGWQALASLLGVNIKLNV